jgi:membrane protein
VPALDWRGLAGLSKRAVKGWRDDGAPTMGASLAFYTLFSLAPLSLVAIGLAGIVVGRDDAQQALIGQVASLVGEQAAFTVEELLDSARSIEQGVVAAIVGFLALIFGATTVFAELRTDLDRIWRHKAPARGGVMKMATARFFSFLLVAGIGVLLLLSLAGSTLLAALGTRLFGASQAALYAIEFVSSLLVVTVLFAMIYKLLPSTRLAWNDVWIGAAVTSALFWLGKFLISLYITHAAVGSAFGAAGALVLLMVWVYYSAQVFFLGAEFTKEYALRHGSRRNDRRLRRPLAEMQAANEEVVDRRKTGDVARFPTSGTHSALVSRIGNRATSPVLLQGLEAQAMRLRGLCAEALELVFLVLVVIARVEDPLRIALGGEDVRADAVEEPAIVRDHQHRAGVLGERILERPQRLDIEVVGGLVQQQHVAAVEERLGEVQAPALAPG